MLGEGKETRSYCYVGDIVDGMIQSVHVLDEKNEVGPLNLGNEGRITIDEVAQMVIEASGKKIEMSRPPFSLKLSATRLLITSATPSCTFKKSIAWAMVAPPSSMAST